MKNRYVILAAALVMNACLGASYAWSDFVTPLKAMLGLGQGPAQLPFSVFYIAFPVTMIFSGSLYARLGPRRCAILGGLFFGCGWFLAGFGGQHFSVTVVGIGLLGGIGVGFAYIVPIANSILWFPRRKGLVTGLAVAGFGGGAALVSHVAKYLMETRGLTPFATFRALGLVFLVLIVAVGSLQVPLPGAAIRKRKMKGLDKALAEKTFWLLYLAMFAGLAAGIAVIANLKQFGAGWNIHSALNLVVLFALTNAAGRIAWGLLSDHARPAILIRANLIAQAAILLGSPWLLRSSGGLQAIALLAGFNYGGVLVLYAATAARRWGPERLGPIYGWMFSANMPAALAPLFVGYVYDHTGSFALPLTLIAVLLIAAAATVRFTEESSSIQRGT